MAKVVLTDKCNLKCPYCIASDYVNQHGPGFITKDAFLEIIKFIAKTDSSIGFFGGEPTIHPQFLEFVDLALGTTNKGITIFTNGTTLKDWYRVLLDNRVGLLVNVNSKKDTGVKFFEDLKEGLTLVNNVKATSRVKLGLNIFEEDQDFSDFWEAWECCPNPSIRLGVVCPNDDSKRSENIIQYYKRIAPTMMKFLRECVSRGAMFEFDGNSFPICSLSEEDKNEFEFAANDFVNKTGILIRNKIYGSSCYPTPVVRQDKSVMRCLGMSDALTSTINDFEDMQEVERYFYQNIDKVMMHIPFSEECTSCELWYQGECYGGCLGFQKNKFIEARKVINKKYDLTLGDCKILGVKADDYAEDTMGAECTKGFTKGIVGAGMKSSFGLTTKFDVQGSKNEGEI